MLVSVDGSMALFICESTEERQWLEANTNAEPYQWMGRDALAVEMRYAGDVARGAIEAGFINAP